MIDAVDLAELRRRHVVQAADLVAAAAGQPRVDRRRDAERIEVRRRHQRVVGDEEAAEPVAIVAAGHRHAGPQLVLHFGREVPVVAARAVADQRVVGIAGGGEVAAEVLVRHGAALAVHARFARSQSGMKFPAWIADRVEAVVPGAGDGVDRRLDRIVGLGIGRSPTSTRSGRARPSARSVRCRRGRTPRRRADRSPSTSGTFLTSAKLRAATQPFGVAGTLCGGYVAVEVVVADPVGQRQAPEMSTDPARRSRNPWLLALSPYGVAHCVRLTGHLVIEGVVEIVGARSRRLHSTYDFLELEPGLERVAAR